MTNLFRWLPSVEALLNNPLISSIQGINHSRKAEAVRQQIILWRQQIKTNPEALTTAFADEAEFHQALAEAAAENLSSQKQHRGLCRVVNGTGIVLHTNLGRAPLAEQAIYNVNQAISAYCNLEYDLLTGERSGNRFANVRSLICRLTGAEDCLVVNNNAAAIMLALNTFGEGKQGIISRGQLVEIGGSFRVPEIMEKSGISLCEIGTTNKTRIQDYENAINEETGILLVVHPSNFHITGFVETPALSEVAALGKAHGITTIYDWGCGALYPLADAGIGSEANIKSLIRSGIDIITFSGDKLLGGPQCGIVLGSREKIKAMYDNPLTRALRPDKMILAALEGTLKYYENPEDAIKNIPILRDLTKDSSQLAKTAAELAGRLQAISPNRQITVSQTTCPVGGGSLPDVKLTTYAVQIRGVGNLSDFSLQMRTAQVPIIGYIHDNAFNIDVRTLQAGDTELIENAYKTTLK